MNCDKTLELLSAELDGRLSEAEHAELQAHLDECADCRRVYGTLRDVDAMLPETQLEPPKALHDAVMREVRADAAKRQQKKRWVPVAVIGVAARDNACAVLAIWDCASLPELTGSNEKLADGGWVYPVDAETLETLLERYRDVYPMESYAPDGAAKTAAIVLYEQ